jgi:hypothetical protein
VIKEDGLLATFLSEPSFENWRKHTAVSLEEESVSKRVDRIEEITVPSDLEDKLAYVCNIFILSTVRLKVLKFRAGENQSIDRAMAENMRIGRTHNKET